MKNLYILTYIIEGYHHFGGHSTDVNDLTNISIIKEKELYAESKLYH